MSRITRCWAMATSSFTPGMLPGGRCNRSHRRRRSAGPRIPVPPTPKLGPPGAALGKSTQSLTLTAMVGPVAPRTGSVL